MGDSSQSHSHRASIATCSSPTSATDPMRSRSHSHRASIATCASASRPTSPGPVSIPRHRASIATPRRARRRSRTPCLDPTAIEHRSRHRQRRQVVRRAREVSIPQPSSIDRDRDRPSAVSSSLDPTAIEHRSRPADGLDSRCSCGLAVWIPQPSSIDRDRGSVQRAREEVGLDPTAIEHRSRPSRDCRASHCSGCLDPTAIEHRSRPLARP